MRASRFAIRFAASLALTLAARHSWACSCDYSQEWSPSKSRAIFIADVVEVRIRLEGGDPIEYGLLKVRRSFKGAYRPGDLLRTRTNIVGSTCGLSLVGAGSGRLEHVGPGHESHAHDKYWRWFLEVRDAQPHWVSSCGVSAPEDNALEHIREAERALKPGAAR